MLNILKVMRNYTFICTHSTQFLKKLPTYMWSMFTHVHPCVAHLYSRVFMSTHARIMNEPKLN